MQRNGRGNTRPYGTVKNHGGTIRFRSELGHGSTFSIYLPLEDEPPSQEAEPSSTVAPLSARHERILVADDEPVILGLCGSMLGKLGYDVALCTDPSQALETYRKEWRNIDLVIVDMIMPKMDGKQLFLALRVINPDAKVILSSGHSLDDDTQTIMSLGFSGFLQKPFRRMDLARTIAEVLRCGGGHCPRHASPPSTL